MLRSLSKPWRPQVIALRASKNLENLSLEELVGILKKGKSLILTVQKPKKTSLSKALKVYSDGKVKARSFTKKKKKDKSPIICYECKKPRHFKSECTDLEKNKDKKKKLFVKKKGKKEDDDEEEEQANLCLMVEAIFEVSEAKQEEVDYNDLNSL
ncbi:hypothetical protein JHK87_049964 [Glycine soja]|uniref:CCHC-type domain-containing protein n=1 Tax=Glycine max TaxID=3847 RepID=A0A0R0ID94_SOYBN|nr:hypothetical protein JHK87_049964 [Glycine soja]